MMPLTEQAQAFLDTLAEARPPGWEELTPAEGREAFESFADLFGEGPQLERVEDVALPGDIGVRLFSDGGSSQQPAVMYFHGGGWVLGNTRTHDALCRRLAKASRCTVISVDYGLSPEHPYPQPLDDCYLATKAVVEQAAELRVDPERIAVAGDSAGGNLATAVAQMARDQGGPAIRLQVLIYPVIEPDFATSTYTQFAEGYGLSKASMQWFWQQYLGGAEADGLAAPSRAASLAGLPPAHVVTAEYDVLRDEGEKYAQMLTEAGVSTTRRRYDGNLHGFIHFAGAFDDGIHATNEIAEVLRGSMF